MVDTPAMTSAAYGNERVVLNSPHSEIPPEHGGGSTAPEIIRGELEWVPGWSPLSGPALDDPEMAYGKDVDRDVLTLAPADCSQVCADTPEPLSTSQQNVLILGDSVSSPHEGYFNEVARELPSVKLQHLMTHGGGQCGTSVGVLACLDTWLESRHGWDVISLNWGLHDVCPGMYAPVSLDDYEANLRVMRTTLSAALRLGGALLWVSTTPVPPSYAPRDNSDVVDINARAWRVFGEDAAVDLYGAVVNACRAIPGNAGYPESSDCPQLQPNGVHFGYAGQESAGFNFTGQRVAQGIQGLLHNAGR